MPLEEDEEGMFLAGEGQVPEGLRLVCVCVCVFFNLFFKAPDVLNAFL